MSAESKFAIRTAIDIVLYAALFIAGYMTLDMMSPRLQIFVIAVGAVYAVLLPTVYAVAFVFRRRARRELAASTMRH
jgi:F0F1-type ATP synthase assembly protein I